MKLLLALTMFFCGSLQDEAAIAELLRRLGSDQVLERERAERDLVALGEAALPALRKASDDPDLERKARVGAVLSTIEWNLLLQPCDVAKDLTDEERKFL